MKILDVSSIQEIPGYVEILKFVLKSQIQNLVEQLQDHAGEETLVLSANLTAGTLSHLESERGQGFLESREDIKSQFLTHCLQGKQKYHTAEPPCHRTVCPKAIIPPQINPSLTRVRDEQPSHCKPNSIEMESTCSRKTCDASNMLSQTDGLEFIHAGTSKLTDVEGGKLISSRSTQPDNSKSMETVVLKSSETGTINSPQYNSLNTLTQADSTVNNKTSDVDNDHGDSSSDTQRLFSDSHADTHNLLLLGNQAAANKFLLPGNHEIQHTVSNSLTMQTSDKLRDPLFLTPTHQNIKVDGITWQNPNKLFPLNSLMSGSVNNLPFVAQSGHFTNLSTINHSAVKDIMNFPLNTPVTPQFLPNLQSTFTPVKVADKNQNVTLTVKSIHTSLSCSDSLYNMSANNNSSPVKTGAVSYPHHEQHVGMKAGGDLTLLQDTTRMTSDCSMNVFQKQGNKSTSQEKVCKTTKRKQKRNTGPKSQSENASNTQIKKPRVFTPEFSTNEDIVTMHPITVSCQSKDPPPSSHSVTSLITNFSSAGTAHTAGFSLLKMQPVVLIDDPNQGKRKIFIEPGSLNTGDSCSKTMEHSKSLLDELNGHIVNTGGNVIKHVTDGKEKDKTKKTLSSKIDEITQRITKDDTIKQHTVQTSDSDQDNNMASCSNNSRIKFPGNHSNNDSFNTDSPNVSTPPSVEHVHDGDSKLKDGSRASHRKPKLPRYNIGVASDDEDNSDVSKLADITSPETPNKSNVSHFPISPTAVNIGQDDAQDIINIQVSGEDSETSFPHINLEELADGLLLTDLPIVSYYNNVEDSSKSLIESVFNLKPSRDPNTKKPLNSQSVIVSGSKLEKDWVKCPLCPDKFLTVEALQYHIKNVNHVTKRYECDLCKRKFSQLRDMERHRRIHTGERPFTCDVCNKSFARKDNLKSHARKHTIK